MSSRTSSLSTLTTVPSTMSPSLKYLMVSSIAARNASSDPMSLTATWGAAWACVLLVMCGLAPDADRESCGHAGNPCRVTRFTGQPGHISHDRGGTHEDTAQRSAYESKPEGSIEPGYDTASVGPVL